MTEAKRQLPEAVLNFFRSAFRPMIWPTGISDAVNALRQLTNPRERDQRIAYAVQRTTGQLLVSVHLALGEKLLWEAQRAAGAFTGLRTCF